MWLYLEEQFLEVDSWVKEYTSSIFNYITVVNDYIAISLILTFLGLMTTVIIFVKMYYPFLTFWLKFLELFHLQS